jgi:4-diphosphocytidyl-2-C-methyl-D-erythritol kinase
MQEVAFAKINLALHVRGKEPDGYHRIETVFAFAEDGDSLSVSGGKRLSLEIQGPFAGSIPLGSDNLVLRAAETLRRHFAVTAGAALRLEKNLPPASGIGGGSADAAAALRLLNKWWNLGANETLLTELARDLGADVPACVLSRARLGTGRGDRLLPIDDSSIRSAPLLLVNPGIPVQTPAVFRGWDGVDRGALDAPTALDALKKGRNDLEQAARRLAQPIGDVLARLGEAAGAMTVRMSGSGATCFALFRSGAERNKAAAAIASERPSWWQLSTRIRG